MRQLRVLAWWQRFLGKADKISTSDKQPPDPKNKSLDNWKSPDKAIAFGHRIIFYGVFTFLAWAALAPLDEGVPASGAVAVESRRKAIAPLSSGMIATVSVTENQRVKAGDILLTLENTQPQAAYDSAIQQHFAMAARLARLEAEQRRETYLQLPEELEDLDKEAWAREMLTAEVNLLGSRNSSLENELAILRERHASEEERLRGARQQLASRQQQYELLNEQVRGLTKLVDAGHSPRNQLLETQRTLVEVSRLTSELETSIAVSANNVSEFRLQQSQRRRDFQRDLEAQIVESRRDVTLLKEKVKAVKEDIDRTVIKSPIDGQIVSLQGLASGSAVTTGMHLMDVIPEGDRLLVDVQVATHLIDRVSPGLLADVRINAFPEDPQLVIAGQVLSLSADQLQNPTTGQAYYLARVEITTEGHQQLGQRKLRPGMPVDVIIKTGERSFLAYLVKPLMRRIFSSFREN